MKIAIVSDMHLGYERFRDDARRQAGEALEKAAEASDMIIIPGDIFDYRRPSPDVIAEAMALFRNTMKKNFKARVSSFEGEGFAYTDVPIIAIPGTHERRAQNAANPVSILGMAGLVVDASQARVTIEKTTAGKTEKVCVFGLGGIAEERFRETLKEVAPKGKEGCFNIFMFHQSVYELLPFSDSFIRIDDLPDGFDLYVDGHIHSRVEMKCHGRDFLIPGSTVITQLKENEQDSKGFFVYDTEERTYTFHRINSRKFAVEEIDVDGKGPAEIEELAREKARKVIASSDGAKPIIRIVLAGKLGNGIKLHDVSVHGLAKEFQDSAILEVSKLGVKSEEIEQEAMEIRTGELENASLRDYGLGVFMEKLNKAGYRLEFSPSELFDLLSSDAKKEEVISTAIKMLSHRTADNGVTAAHLFKDQ